MTNVVAWPDTDDSASLAVARRVRGLLAEKRIKQTELMEALHLAQPAVSRRVNGVVPFDANELAVTARVLGTTVGYLFGEASPVDGERARQDSNLQPLDPEVKPCAAHGRLAPVIPLAARRHTIRLLRQADRNKSAAL